MDYFYQYELVRGTRHWIAWFDNETLPLAFRDGFSVLHRYGNTPMIKNDEGRLVPPER